MPKHKSSPIVAAAVTPKVLRDKRLRLDLGALERSDADTIAFLAKVADAIVEDFGYPCADHGGCTGCQVWTGFYAILNAVIP